MKKLDLAASILIFVGAINWGLVGIFNLNLIDFFIENTGGDRFLYAVIGMAAVYKLVCARNAAKKEEA